MGMGVMGLIMSHGVTFVIAMVGFVFAWRYWNRVGMKAMFVFFAARLTMSMYCWTHISTMWPTDLDGWYQHALWMLDGGYFPGKDFLSPYCLGFNGLLTLSVSVWRSPLVIPIAFTLFEILAMFLLRYCLAELFGERVAKRAIILYLTMPCCLGPILAAQDEPVLLMFVALMLCLLLKGRMFAVTLAGFLAFFFSKILAPFYFVGYLFGKKSRWAYILFLFCVIYWGVIYVLGINPFDFRFGRCLGCDGIIDDILAIKGKGHVWLYLPELSPLVKNIVMLVFFVTVGLAFMPGLQKFVEDRRAFTKLAMSMTCVLYLIFNITYSGRGATYVIPCLPFLCALFLNAQTQIPSYRVRQIMGGLFVVWSFVSVYIEPSSRILERFNFIFIPSYFCLDITFMVLILWVCREHLSNPFKGVPAALKFLVHV